MTFLLDFLYGLAFILFLPKMLYRRFTQGRYKDGWHNRLGKVDRLNQSKRTIWIHAVSVGEVNATHTIIERLQKELPEYEVVLSTTTDTGYARATNLYKDSLSVFYFPMDFSFIMRKAFKRLSPAICLLMELEVWPNFSNIAKKNNIPVVVVNGRLSERSYPRYKAIKPITKWMFSKVSLFLSQAEEYSQRFKTLGVENSRVVNTGTLKYDTAQIGDNIAGKDELKTKLGLTNERLLVAGGTGPNEEEIILDVFSKLKDKEEFADLRLAIVPRKPERFDDVNKLILQAGFKVQRYSNIKDKEASSVQVDPDAVILGDTMGDLRKFYAISTCVFVGRSLCPMGGSDMMESSAMKKFTCFGPHTFNFKETVSELVRGNGAVVVNDENELYNTLDKALNDNSYREEIASNGQNVIINNQGATDKTIKAIKTLLE